MRLTKETIKNLIKEEIKNLLLEKRKRFRDEYGNRSVDPGPDSTGFPRSDTYNHPKYRKACRNKEGWSGKKDRMGNPICNQGDPAHEAEKALKQADDYSKAVEKKRKAIADAEWEAKYKRRAAERKAKREFKWQKEKEKAEAERQGFDANAELLAQCQVGMPMYNTPFCDWVLGREKKKRRKRSRRPRFLRRYKNMRTYVGSTKEDFDAFYKKAMAAGYLKRRRDRDYVWGKKHQQVWDKLNASPLKKLGTGDYSDAVVEPGMSIFK